MLNQSVSGVSGVLLSLIILLVLTETVLTGTFKYGYKSFVRSGDLADIACWSKNNLISVNL